MLLDQGSNINWANHRRRSSMLRRPEVFAAGGRETFNIITLEASRQQLLIVGTKKKERFLEGAAVSTHARDGRSHTLGGFDCVLLDEASLPPGIHKIQPHGKQRSHAHHGGTKPNQKSKKKPTLYCNTPITPGYRACQPHMHPGPWHESCHGRWAPRLPIPVTGG